MAAEQTAVGDITATMEHGLHVSRGDARSVQGRGAAVDITALVDTVTRSLPPGGMIHAPTFTLQDAMGAVEMMDPKMDSGMLDDREDAAQPMDRTTLLEHAATMTGEEVLAIALRLFCCESAWLSGHNLAQTVWSCQYTTLATVRIRHPLLRAYIDAQMRSLSLMVFIMNVGGALRDEDVSTELFGVELPLALPTVDIYRRLDAEIERVGETLLELAVLVRYRKHWIDLLESVKEDYRLPSNFDATIADMIRELEQLVASPRLRTVDVMMVHGFDSNAYRRLNSAAPPRDITLPSVSEALALQLRVVKELQGMKAMYGSIRTVSELFETFLRFARRSPEPNGLTRSILVRVALPPSQKIFSQCHVHQLVMKSNERGTGAPFYTSVDVKVEEAMEHVRIRISEVIQETVRVMCLNTARMCRKLHKMLYLWDELQAELEGIDVKLSQTVLKLPENKPAFFLALFAYNLKLELMLAILAVSIELELYLDHELPMVYCYMEFLLRNQCENYEQVASMQSVLNATAKTCRPSTPFEPTVNATRHQLAYNARTIALGLCKLIAHITAPSSSTSSSSHSQPMKWTPLTEAEILWIQRFRHFRLLSSPPSLPWEYYMAATGCDEGGAAGQQREGATVETTLHMAERYFTMAQKALSDLAKTLIQSPVSPKSGSIMSPATASTPAPSETSQYHAHSMELCRAAVGNAVAAKMLALKDATGSGRGATTSGKQYELVHGDAGTVSSAYLTVKILK